MYPFMSLGKKVYTGSSLGFVKKAGWYCLLLFDFLKQSLLIMKGHQPLLLQALAHRQGWKHICYYGKNHRMGC